VKVEIEAGKPVLVAGGKEKYTLTPESFVRLGQLCGIPGPYSSKCPIHLIVPHINYWASEELEDIQLLVDMDDQVQAFCKPSNEFVLPSTIFSIVEDALDGEIVYDKPSFDVDFCHIGATSPSTEYDKGDDVMHGGLSIVYAPDGKVPMTVSSYLLKQICTNGMVAPMSTFKWRRNSNDQLEVWLAEAAAAAVGALREEADRLIDMKNYVVTEHVGDVLNSLYSTYRVPVDIQETVTARVLNTGAETMYDIVDAFTWVISHDIELTDDPKTQHKMMMAAGEMAAHPEACSQCHRVFR